MDVCHTFNDLSVIFCFTLLKYSKSGVPSGGMYGILPFFSLLTGKHEESTTTSDVSLLSCSLQVSELSSFHYHHHHHQSWDHNEC
jgi:hypothetical protein